MTNRLPVFGCLAHDPQGILAAVYWLALVDLELYPNLSVSIRETSTLCENGNGNRELP
jgi:hypothetical protein